MPLKKNGCLTNFWPLFSHSPGFLSLVKAESSMPFFYKIFNHTITFFKIQSLTPIAND